MSEPPHLLAFHGVRPLPFAFTNPSCAFPSTCHIVAERRHFSPRYRAWCRFESDGRHGKLVGFPSVEDWALNGTCPTFLAMVKLCQRVFFLAPSSQARVQRSPRCVSSASALVILVVILVCTNYCIFHHGRANANCPSLQLPPRGTSATSRVKRDGSVWYSVVCVPSVFIHCPWHRVTLFAMLHR